MSAVEMQTKPKSKNRIRLSENFSPNSVPDVSLQEYYHREVKQGLEKITTSLSKLQKEPDNRDYLQQIRASAQTVSDLSMIHGYEGVETIANKIRFTFHQILYKKDPIHHSYIPKVELAVEAIRQVMELEDDIISQTKGNKFNKKMEQKQKRVKSCAQKVSSYFDALFTNQLELPFGQPDIPQVDSEVESDKLEEPENENNSELFDIREIDSVMTLDFDSPSINSDPVSSNPNDSGVVHKVEGDIEDVTPSFTQPMESDKADIKELALGAKEQLSEFEQAVYELQVIPHATNAIQKINKVCSALQETARQLDDKNLSFLLNPLQELIGKKLMKTEPVSETLLDLLSQTTDLLYNHLDYNKDDEKEIKKLGQKIEKILKVQKVK
jgi:chemotaxis protein histidine kinase CheA